MPRVISHNSIMETQIVTGTQDQCSVGLLLLLVIDLC